MNRFQRTKQKIWGGDGNKRIAFLYFAPLKLAVTNKFLHYLFFLIAGDVFILVFSLDNRESFDEVKRLQKQILEVKSCLKNKTKESADLPMVICGNKNDHSEMFRKVRTDEGENLVSSDENCAYFEVSAKKNTNVDEMFYVLFSMAKLPHEMSPSLHRKISIQYGDTFQQKSFRMRRVKDMDAYGMISPFARRPSVNSDLKYIKSKVLREGQSREREKCTVQWRRLALLSEDNIHMQCLKEKMVCGSKEQARGVYWENPTQRKDNFLWILLSHKCK